MIFIARLDSIRQTLQIDIGFGDVIIPEPQALSYPVLIRDLPAPDIFAYSLETVLAEKFHAMIDLAESNSRYKDFYDVYKILSQNELDEKNLKNAVHATFSNRNTNYIANHPIFSDDFVKDQNRNLLWNYFLKKIKYHDDLTFEMVMMLIKSNLQTVYESMASDFLGLPRL